ncbi:metallophosphoesterase [Vulgatibacter incomptus]|uniref:Putative phosphoesterase n=1 Tax=Vulgatibacter incomptus TaxID=1391653 RepID=A0A0K1P8X1_9BACT|nr:metallophosphoesterase [Vulgatibacter incomptus]AKU89970.1 putative phosphoesterase [Vulgatibacter incomptus]
MKASQIVFLLAVSIIVALGHWYLWMRLVRDPGWPEPWPLVGAIALIALAIYLPAAIILARWLPRDIAGPTTAIAFVWMGFGFLLIAATVAADVARWLGLGAFSLWALFSKEPVDPVRRELLGRGVAATASILAVGSGALALRGGLGEVDVVEVPVSLGRLPRQLSGYTIVQLSDVHVGPTIGRRFVEQIVAKANAERPDAIVITGDLVDGRVAELARHVEPLARLQARHGVYFITGNHEYYSGVEPWVAHLKKLGIRVLRNERVSLGDGAASFDLAGIDDLWGAQFGEGQGADMEKALAGRDPERELVLLAHQPKAIDQAASLGVGLQLSGHTHGGQIFPFNAVVHFAQPYVAGLHRHTEDTQIYVSRGTGCWGPPMRLGAPAEVTKIVLA